MKFLVVGLGSMGKRRIRNLQALKQKFIIGFDPREDRCKEVEEKYNLRAYQNFEEVLEEKPDIMIISTPPDTHMSYAKIALKNKINFFTEASVTQDGVVEIIDCLKDSEIIGMPSCTMRYHPIVLKVKDIMNQPNFGKPLMMFHHFGQYLPDWHPWEDYREFYVSRKETGACREIVPFELVWITWLFGKIDDVIGVKEKISDLDADIDDIYSVLVNFENNTKGNLTVEVISKYPLRQLKIITENGVILADWTERVVKSFTKEQGWKNFDIDDGMIESGYIHGEGTYISEISDFIKAVKKEILLPYSYEDDLKILKILDFIEKSSDSKKAEKVN